MTAQVSRRILFVTGLSGAGMSSALKALEDLGHEVFDNFPLSLVSALLDDNAGDRPIAIGIDTRTRGFDPAAIATAVHDFGARLIFITCDETVLQKRFTETRRRHPLASDRPVAAGIRKELELLYPLRDVADPTIGTRALSIHDLKRILTGLFPRLTGQSLTVTVQSFGFKYGMPRHADIVMDVRFLKNPHWDKNLNPQTGLDEPVRDYVESDPAYAGFMTRFKALIEPLFDKYKSEGRSYLTIALGCTGGKHRSVVAAENLSGWLRAETIDAVVDHRDIRR